MPCYDTVARDTATSLFSLGLRIGLNPPEGLAWLGIDWRSSSNLPHSRAVLSERAVALHKATHVLWVDSDMAFPPDALHRLLARDVAYVGVSVPRRTVPHYASARGLDGKPLPPGGKGIEEASLVGFGVTLMRTELLAGLTAPAFAHHDEEGYCSDDVVFCRKLREAGHKVYVDHDLSAQCRHVGSVAFGAEHVEAFAGEPA